MRNSGNVRKGGAAPLTGSGGEIKKYLQEDTGDHPMTSQKVPRDNPASGGLIITESDRGNRQSPRRIQSSSGDHS